MNKELMNIDTRKVINIYGMKVDMIQIPGVIEAMEGWIKDKSFGNYIVISNANDAAISRSDSKVKQAVNESSLSVPDGFSLILLARLNGHPLKRRVYGPDLMHDFLKVSESKGYSHFFYGSTEDILNKLKLRFKKEFPSLKLAGVYSPPFGSITKEKEEEIVDKINRASPDVLWVGLGCPKQQLWMHRHRDKFKVPVMVGVGAAFDFIAKAKAQAPNWMRDNGLEWLFRLSTEPKRLWKRYLVANWLFLWFFLREFIRLKIVANFSKNGIL